jgi:hypothetical protein
MHHTLKLYSRHRESALRFYMFWARWTRIPLIGRLVRWVANTWGRNLEGAYVLTTDEAGEIMDACDSLAVGPCSCRKLYHNCDNPVDVEIMLSLNGNVFVEERPQDYREISKQEAKEILRECHERGLIHSIVKCREDFYAICNCCTCCCVPLRLHNQYGIGSALTRRGDIVQVFREHQHAV